MKPAFASMIILQATTAWNDFLWPLIVMSKNDRFTLSVGLQTYLSPYGNNYNLLFAWCSIICNSGNDFIFPLPEFVYGRDDCRRD